jgi:hypothetical protein
LVYANIPVITVGHIERNDLAGEWLQRRYACSHHLGLFRNVTADQLISAIQLIWNDEAKLAEMRSMQRGLIDGRGLDRIGAIISKSYSRKSK